MADQQPAAFEIIEVGGARSASNGLSSITMLPDLAGQGRMFRRRAQRGLSMKPAREVAIPLLNQLSGELLGDSDLNGTQVAARIRAVADAIEGKPPENVEWAVVDVDGLRIYFDGRSVMVTRADLIP
jgi:hypothetical protein